MSNPTAPDENARPIQPIQPVPTTAPDENARPTQPSRPAPPTTPDESASAHPAPAPGPATAYAAPPRGPATAYPVPPRGPATAYPAPDPWAAPPARETTADGSTRPRTPWLALGATAVTAGLVGSLATGGLLMALDDDATPAAAPTVTTEEDDGPSTVPVSGSDAENPDWQAVAAAVRESVVAIDVRTAAGAGTGSGVLIDTDGNILTNDHVVGDAVDGGLRVTLADGRVHEATVVGLDPTTDLAVIRLSDPPDDLRPAGLGSSDGLQVGEPVMAVGNPLGLDSTVTTGIVSALDRPVSTSDGQGTVVTNAIQVDAAVNPGNSGGPLFDATGQVIGITSSIASLSSGGGTAGSIGLGFAIPVDLAQRVAAELVEDGTAEHAFLGVGLSDGIAEGEGSARRGAKVEEVTADSPADAAGLRADDVIVAIDGDPVSGAESLTAFVREHAAGAAVTVSFVRDGQTQDVEVTLAARVETPSTRGSGGGSSDGSSDGQGGQTDPGTLPWDFFDQG